MMYIALPLIRDIGFAAKEEVLSAQLIGAISKEECGLYIEPFEFGRKPSKFSSSSTQLLKKTFALAQAVQKFAFSEDTSANADVH